MLNDVDIVRTTLGPIRLSDESTAMRIPNQDYWFARALLPNGWANRVLVSILPDGQFASVVADTERPEGVSAFGTAIPGIPNTHSHAFQRAMAGLSEYRRSTQDTFWAWREAMYRLANNIGPADLRNIAAHLYIDMLKAGYTNVAEFHYVHHQHDGQPFSRLSEMSQAILDAADVAGIGVTCLPVLYVRAGFDVAGLDHEQRRFGNTVDQYLRLFQQVRARCESSQLHRAGMALHSLRAVPSSYIIAAHAEIQHIDSTAPMHIHIAEQVREVEQCIQEHGRRPVEFLLETVPVDERWCLIHATHMTASETKDLARSGAVVSICPTTEANLGDGVFPLAPYLENGGAISIGSDSNATVGAIEELRWLEYVQRLVHRVRNIVKGDSNTHTGFQLIQRCLDGGQQASQRRIGKISAGYRADLLVIDDSDPIIASTPIEYLLDTLIFGGVWPVIKDVMVGGKWRISDCRHENEDAVAQTFARTIDKLRAGF